MSGSGLRARTLASNRRSSTCIAATVRMIWPSERSPINSSFWTMRTRRTLVKRSNRNASRYSRVDHHSVQTSMVITRSAAESRITDDAAGIASVRNCRPTLDRVARADSVDLYLARQPGRRDRRADQGLKLIGRREERHDVVAHETRAEDTYSLGRVDVAGGTWVESVHVLRRPGSRFSQEESQYGPVRVLARRQVLPLGDRPALIGILDLRQVLRPGSLWEKSISPGNNNDVRIGVAYQLKDPIEGVCGGGSELLHRGHLVSQPTERSNGSSAILR